VSGGVLWLTSQIPQIQGDEMAITFQKRQKEMKRQEKAREKLERRAQRKLAKAEGKELFDEFGNEIVPEPATEPEKPEIPS
jgi:hypothetical protein